MLSLPTKAQGVRHRGILGNYLTDRRHIETSLARPHSDRTELLSSKQRKITQLLRACFHVTSLLQMRSLGYLWMFMSVKKLDFCSLLSVDISCIKLFTFHSVHWHAIEQTALFYKSMFTFSISLRHVCVEVKERRYSQRLWVNNMQYIVTYASLPLFPSFLFSLFLRLDVRNHSSAKLLVN